MDTNTETDNSSNVETGEVVDTTENNESVETVEQTESRREFSDYEKQLYNQLQAEKAKAEKLKKELEAKAVAPQQTKKEDKVTTLTREEAIAFAKGFDEADVDEAKFISERTGVPLLEAFNTTRFKSYKETKELDRKNEEASMRASRGSQVKPKKTLSSTGLSDEEHKAMALERMRK